MIRAGLPIFVQVAGRPVIVIGDGPAADAKRRLLARAGARTVGEESDALFAIVAVENDPAPIVARLRGRGLLVNAVDRPDLCDLTLPAIVDRDPVVVAIGTGGVSAGLAAALRQRLEALLPAGLGRLADAFHAARDALRARYPDAAVRRRAIAALLGTEGPLDPLRAHDAPVVPIAGGEETAGKASAERIAVAITSPDPDELTLRAARLLAQADRVVHAPDMPATLLARARADAERLPAPAGPAPSGLTVDLVWSQP